MMLQVTAYGLCDPSSLLYNIGECATCRLRQARVTNARWRFVILALVLFVAMKVCIAFCFSDLVST